MDDKYTTFNPEFEGVVAGHTMGEISRNSSILVQFTSTMIPESMVGEELSQRLFQLEPEVNGKAKWKNPFTLEFTPDENLKSGTVYQVSLNTGPIKDSLPDMPSSFRFQFRTMPQGINVELAGLQTIDMKDFRWQKLSGTISTLDYEPNETIEKIFFANMGNQDLKINWEHEQDNYVHTFSIDSISRQEEPEELVIAWEGESYDMPDGKKSVEVPQMGAFTLQDHYVVNHPQPYVQLIFSDPVDPEQNLQGLIRIEDMDTRISVNSNQVKIYPARQASGFFKLSLEPGIRNMAGTRWDQKKQYEIIFEEPLPRVRLVGKGVIIPQSSTLPFVFETIGLRAVDVRVIKIYEQNVLQFLQASTLDNHDEINRVGQVIVQKFLEFNKSNPASLNQWTRHSLDLRSVIEPEPGAVYEVALGFRPAYALNPCATQLDKEGKVDMLKVSDSYNTMYWYDNDYYYYDWNQRDNPCDLAYYRQSRVVKRNILASEIGMIVKQSEKENVLILTHLKTTDPLGGVEVELYDFQQQLIGQGISNSQGQVKISADSIQAPFIAVAKFGNQRGYLRLNESNALSLSRFDIGGSDYQDGLKGFIYGERGVWRPGDEIFLTFILEDTEDILPDNHPVNFKLIDPQGQTVTTMVRNEGLNGFYTFPIQTSANAPTGNYQATIKVGGTEFSKTVKVETITPNRIKIQFDYEADALTARMKQNTVQLKASWLHGAPARNLEARVNVALEPQKTGFDEYSTFSFDDPVRSFNYEEFVLFEGKLDQNGNARIPAAFSLDARPPGMLSANFRTQVYEPGGSFSVDQFVMDYHPYEVYVGIKTPETERWGNVLELNEAHEIEFVTMGQDGKLVSRNNLQLDVYKLEWKWWWDQSYNDLSNFQGRIYSDIVQSARVSTPNGKGSWMLKIDEPNWGRYLVRITDPSGHATGQVVYVDEPGWRGRAGAGNNEGAKMLSFTADKESYEVGETVTLNIPTGFTGRALVSIERGAEILETTWIEAQEGMTTYTFKTTAEMAPNVYAHISLLQPHAQTANDLPIRLYGVIPIFIEDPQTYLEPEINMPDVLRPNEEVMIRVSEANSKPMTYTIAMIDEGLLDITRFKTPAPHDVFYQREALHVKTWDIFDQVVGAYGGEIGSLLSIGGDGTEAVDPDASKQSRFRPVVKFLGPFSLRRGRKETHTIQMPNYVGSVRTMVIAGQDGAYGHAEKSTPVKQPLMVLGTLPRVLGPTETLKLSATVFAMENNIREVTLSVETNEMLEIDGPSQQNLKFNSTGDQVANFNIKVKPYLGTGHVTITARSGREVAIYETDIAVRMPNPPITEVVSASLAPGETWTQAYKPVGVQGTNQGILELSAIPPLNLGKRLNYLIRYPYGCLEQTTSSAFPQLYLSQLLELKADRKKDTEQNIRAAIDRVRRFQLSNGGFAYWPGNREANTWSTNYVGHFLLEAQNAGYYVPQDMLNNWKQYQRLEAENWTGNAPTPWFGRAEELSQAYRLYLLALAGAPNIGAMNRLRQEDNLYIAAKYHLAAAYHLAGQKRIAERIRKGLDKNVPDYRRRSYTFGSALRDQAIILDALSTMDAKDEASELVSGISDRLSSDEWLSTQTTAFCLVAMANYVGRQNPDQAMKFSLANNGTSPASMTETTAVWQRSLDPDAATQIQITNTSNQILFTRIASEGVPLQGDNTSSSNGVSMSVQYKQLNGQILNLESIPQGTDFYAEVKITNTGKRGTYTEMALNQIFPSGWEVYNSRLFNMQNGGDTPDYQDIRDDRVYTFFEIPEGKTKIFILRLNAAYQGRFYLPTVYTEAMYEKSINAKTGGKWINVVNPPQG